MVDKPVVHATVTILAVGGPPHSWGTVLREGSLSLSPHLTHWMGHQNCNNWMGGHQW